MLANTWQFWILILAWLLLGEKLRGAQWVSVGVGLFGLVLIIEPWRLHGVVSSLLALAGAVCFAGGAVVAKVLRRRHEVELLSFTAWQSLFGSIPLVVVAALVPGGGIHWTGTFIWSLAYSLLIGTALGSFLWLYALNALPANVAGIGRDAGRGRLGILDTTPRTPERSGDQRHGAGGVGAEPACDPQKQDGQDRRV
jgi:drug/metabolite transporter (DMT)-like permease